MVRRIRNDGVSVTLIGPLKRKKEETIDGGELGRRYVLTNKS